MLTVREVQAVTAVDLETLRFAALGCSILRRMFKSGSERLTPAEALLLLVAARLCRALPDKQQAELVVQCLRTQLLMLAESLQDLQDDLEFSMLVVADGRRCLVSSMQSWIDCVTGETIPADDAPKPSYQVTLYLSVIWREAANQILHMRERT